MVTNEDIIDYYKFSKLDYQLYNGGLTDLSMHYGLWGDTTQSHREALRNENRVVASLAQLTRLDRVIDLGCGYGSTAVWLAVNLGCKVVGITLGDHQVSTARRLAKRHNVEHLTKFVAMDFHNIRFSNGVFDAAIGIESISHSKDKLLVLQEAWRVLRPGGRIVIADGFFRKSRGALTERDRRIAQACFNGVHIPPLPQIAEFKVWLGAAGFDDIKWRDTTRNILPTSRRVYHLGKLLLPISRIFGVFGVRALSILHMRAFINQYYAFRDGLGAYGLFFGRKPGRDGQPEYDSRNWPVSPA